MDTISLKTSIILIRSMRAWNPHGIKEKKKWLYNYLFIILSVPEGLITINVFKSYPAHMVEENPFRVIQTDAKIVFLS